MRKDTPYWRSFPLFEVPPGPLPPLADDPWLAAFLGLSCGSRMHLLNLYRKGGGALDTLATYSMKQFGLDSAESAAALASAGLVEPSSAPEAFAAAYSKADLKALVGRAGLSVRSSWSKQRLSEELVTGAPDLAAEVASDSSLVGVASGAEPSLSAVEARASISVTHFQLLCFVE